MDMKVPPPSPTVPPGRDSSSGQRPSSSPKSVVVLFVLAAMLLLAGVLYTLRKQAEDAGKTVCDTATQTVSEKAGQLANPLPSRLPEPSSNPEPEAPASTVPANGAASLPPSGGVPTVAGASPPPGARRQIAISNVVAFEPGADEEYKIREERRDLSLSFLELAKHFSTEPIDRLDFPLFDGQQVHLTDITHKPHDATAGVFFAKVEGEPHGGHVVLAYVNNALAGSIHLPTKGLYFEIRNATPQGGAQSPPRCPSVALATPNELHG